MVKELTLWDRLEAEEIVCCVCGCDMGYGEPPTFEECDCRCHEGSRLLWHMKTKP